MEILITGILLGGTYSLIAIGLNLQYGVARIMNLANGEMLVVGAFVAFWLFTMYTLSPLLAVFVILPLAFVINWGIYRWLMMPLVKRAKNRGQLEVDSILATFGLSFLLVGVMLAVFGGNYFSYSYLAEPFNILGRPFGMNRVVAFGASLIACSLLYVWMNLTRAGMVIRAVIVSPQTASLVGINVTRTSTLAFALGGAITAIGGVLLSSFLTMDASVGVIFTMKALIIVILGGVGDMRGTIISAFVLGLAETAVASLVDPGLTLAAAYLIFIQVLLFRPQGLFGRPQS